MAFFKKYEFIIAWRYLMSKRREGGISIIAWYALIGVVLGVATLVIVQAVMIGFRIEFVEKIIGANSHLAIYKKTLTDDPDKGFYVEEVQNIMQDLRNKKNFKAAYPLVKGQVLASKSNNSAGVEVYGIRKGDLLKIELVNKPTSSEGSMENFNDGVAIGAQLARKLNISIDDTIKLISPNGAKSVFGTIPRVNVYKVKYIFSVGRYDIDSTRIYMPIKDAQVFFNRANQADLIEVLLNNPFDVDEFKNNLEDELAEAKKVMRDIFQSPFLLPGLWAAMVPSMMPFLGGIMPPPFPGGPPSTIPGMIYIAILFIDAYEESQHQEYTDLNDINCEDEL